MRGPGTGKIEMRAGDVFVIETPGGGGFGKAGERAEAVDDVAAQLSK